MRSEGLEPPTPGSEDQCSIQLSYERRDILSEAILLSFQTSYGMLLYYTMLSLIGYIFILFVELLFFAATAIYLIFLIYSSIKGAPYVPTRSKRLDDILKNAKLKKGQIFYELGSGDGRTVRYAVQKYKVNGYGFDINPLLIQYSRLLNWIHKTPEVKFIRADIRDVDLKKVDVLYLFLMPQLVNKIKKKMKKELKKASLIISHGFTIEGWDEKITKTLKSAPFPTYYYRM